MVSIIGSDVTIALHAKTGKFSVKNGRHFVIQGIHAIYQREAEKLLSSTMLQRWYGLG